MKLKTPYRRTETAGAGRFAILAALLVPFALPWNAPATANARTARIGIVVDGPWDRNEPILNLVKSEIRELTGADLPVEFPKTLEADWTPAGVKAEIQRLLDDPEIDLVVAMGILASDQACGFTNLQKPLLAPVVIDADIQNVPRKDGTSGVHNLAYLTIPSAIERDVKAFRNLVPFDRLTILLNHFIAAEMPQLETYVRRLASAPGIDVTVIPVRGSAASALSQLPADAEAVYVISLLQMSSASMDSLISDLNSRRLPTFSAFGETEVERGILAGVSPDIFPRLARRMAVTVQRILAGEEAGSMPTGFTVGETLTLNLKTARAIGYQPTWADIAEARIIGDEREVSGRRLTLRTAMEEAWSNNLDLEASERSVAAGRQQVKQARSTLLPQADASATAVIIDEDRAAASFGAQAEKSLTGSITVSQVIFSEPALARLSIEKSSQKGREGERDQVKLDVAREAGGAYIQVLRALTLESIRRENLQLTRQHLDLARLRQSVGSTRLSDVYRWESEIASNRKAAIEANASRNLAEIQLNRILHRPAEEPFVPAELTLEDPDVTAFFDLCRSYFEDKFSLKTLRAFLVDETVRLTPEIAQIDAGLAAAERSLASANRAFYLPSLALQGSVDRLLDESGAGTGSAGIPGVPAGSIPESDDLDWSVGLKLSFPIFSGGDKLATRGRAHEELEKLRVERQALVDRLEQRTRSAVHNAGASFAAIRESNSAADWAKKNLDLVSEAYARGAVSFIDLLDAQNAYIVADEAAADATYGFLDDLLEVQRSMGRFGFAMSDQDRADFSNRLQTFAQQSLPSEGK